MRRKLDPERIILEVKKIRENLKKFNNIEKFYKPRSISEVARNHGVSRQAIYNIINKYENRDKRAEEKVPKSDMRGMRKKEEKTIGF